MHTVGFCNALIFSSTYTYFRGAEQLCFDIARPPPAMASMDQEITRKIHDSHATISKIREISGNVGMSIGIMHRGAVIHKAHFGHQDVAQQLPPDSNTIYEIASLTKAIVSGCLDILVDRKFLDWNTTLQELLPELASDDTTVTLTQLKNEANVVDVLAHRLGHTQRNMYRMQGHATILMDANDTLKVFADLEPIKEFRSTMAYNNWGYGIAGEIIQRVSGMSVGEFASKHIFEPLQLNRTTLGIPGPDNRARTYAALSDGTSFQVPYPPFSDGKLLASASAGKSTLNDLLSFYGSLMQQSWNQNHGRSDMPVSPIPDVATLWDSRIAINDESSYGLGWVLTDLPAKCGLVGINPNMVDAMPTACKGCPPTRLVYHQGSGVGALSAAYLLPDSQSAIVVLSNSLDLCDSSDWVAQMLLEIVVESPQPNDYVKWAHLASTNSVNQMPHLQKRLRRERILGTRTRSLQDYVGRYWNKLDNFKLDVSIHKERLRITVQGLQQIHYDLDHYQYDCFVWNTTRDEMSKEAFFAMAVIGFHKFSFNAEPAGEIQSVTWAYDKSIPEGEIFRRSGRPSTSTKL
ncbi:hypothetical protein AA0117_g12204 [Alternaria alternata]|uniref:Beta-lactamase/transpeptidase-like protein n=1 Tax=Alternaria alternata TaxID=5599 RepID=A0A4Q4MZA1_ALTAL|nr:hypothetical protein AA0117_g12204 [Alternaria alternata]